MTLIIQRAPGGQYYFSLQAGPVQIIKQSRCQPSKAAIYQRAEQLTDYITIDHFIDRTF